MTLTRRGRALRDIAIGLLLGAIGVGLAYAALAIHEHRRCDALRQHIADNPFAYAYYCTEVQP